MYEQDGSLRVLTTDNKTHRFNDKGEPVKEADGTLNIYVGERIVAQYPAGQWNHWER